MASSRWWMRLPVFLPSITSPYARNFIAIVASTWTSVIWSTWRDIFKMWAIEWTVKTFILGRLYNFSIMEYIHGMEYIHAWRTQKYSPITRPSIIPSSYHYLVMYVLMDEVSNNNVYRQGRCCLLQILNPWIWLNADPPSRSPTCICLNVTSAVVWRSVLELLFFWGVGEPEVPF